MQGEATSLLGAYYRVETCSQQIGYHLSCDCNLGVKKQAETESSIS